MLPTAPPRTVLVLGANGRFGPAAVKAFAHAGWRLLPQVRPPQAALPSRAEALTPPLGQTAAPAPPGCGRGRASFINLTHPPAFRHQLYA